MLTVPLVIQWMTERLEIDACLYQQDVVDHLIKAAAEEFLVENADGNQALSRPVLNAFRIASGDGVVWVKSGLYWRFRVPEDEDGRDARG